MSEVLWRVVNVETGHAAAVGRLNEVYYSSGATAKRHATRLTNESQKLLREMGWGGQTYKAQCAQIGEWKDAP